MSAEIHKRIHIDWGICTSFTSMRTYLSLSFITMPFWCNAYKRKSKMMTSISTSNSRYLCVFGYGNSTHSKQKQFEWAHSAAFQKQWWMPRQVHNERMKQEKNLYSRNMIRTRTEWIQNNLPTKLKYAPLHFNERVINFRYLLRNNKLCSLNDFSTFFLHQLDIFPSYWSLYWVF